MDKTQVMILLVIVLSVLSIVLLIIIFFKKIIIALNKFWLFTIGYLRHLMRKALRWSIYTFRKMLAKILEKPTFLPIAYQDLAPINSADPDKTYYRTLKWAIGNENIHNVALTGPYGSGKSSILRTFQKLNTKEYYLNLSLAAFKDFKADDKVDQVIELSILKQIFYHVRYTSIPDSRFKRIKRQRKRTLAGKSLLFLLWLLTLLFLTKTEYYGRVPKWGDFYNTYGTFLYFGILAAFLLGTFYFIYETFSLYKNSRFNKVNITSGQLEFAPEAESSILNKHLDEILYFFEATQFTVLIFEDLDRFKTPEIFTKLREINNLINSAQQINRKITFIYALKDNVFVDERRTKFFDFIIPVIPVVNSSNSGELLINMIKDAGLEGILKEIFVSDISLYIEDMRLLINIINEFILYKMKLGDFQYNYENLFSIILYKNLYPKDFAKLHNNKGLVFDFFSGKKMIIKRITMALEGQFATQTAALAELEQTFVESIEELRSIYLQAIAEKFTETFNGNIVLADGIKTLGQIKRSGEFFNSLRRTNNITYGSYNFGQRNSGVSFVTVEKSVNANLSYDERESRVANRMKSDIGQLKSDLAKIKAEITRLSSLTIAEIFENHNLEDFEPEFAKHKLLSYLIRYGKIDEQYHTYISYFYAVNMTKEDMDFVFSNKNCEPLAFTFQLFRISELFKKLVNKEFAQPAILNNSLIDYLLSDEKTYDESLRIIFKQLSNQKSISTDYIENYLDKGKELPKFVERLVDSWDGFWDFIDMQSDLEEHKKDRYLGLLFDYASVKGFTANNASEYLQDFISTKSDFLNFANGLESVSKLQDKIKALDIKFSKLSDFEGQNSLFDFIYNNNLYQLNKTMIRLIIRQKGNVADLEQLSLKNYTTVLSSSAEKLKKYIKSDIENYLADVLLQIPTNKMEEEETARWILVDDDIDEDYKVAFIKQQELRYSNIDEVPTTFWSLLLQEDKILPKWMNLLGYYKDKENIVDGYLADYINIAHNFKALEKDEFKEAENFGQSAFEDFASHLINSNKISTSAVEGFIDAFGFYLYNIDFKNLQRDRVSVLINKNGIEYIQTNYDEIKTHHGGLNITFAEHNIKAFMADLDTYELDALDFTLLILSLVFSREQKQEIILKLTPEVVDGSSDLADVLLEYFLINNSSPEFEIFTKIIEFASIVEDKLSLINRNLSAFSDAKISIILRALGDPFSEMAEKGPTPRIPKYPGAIELIRALDADRNYISSHVIKEEYLKVNTKRK